MTTRFVHCGCTSTAYVVYEHHVAYLIYYLTGAILRFGIINQFVFSTGMYYLLYIYICDIYQLCCLSLNCVCCWMSFNNK